MRALDLSKPRFLRYVLGAQFFAVLAEIVAFCIFYHILPTEIPIKFAFIVSGVMNAFVLFASSLIWLSHYLDYKSDLSEIGERRKNLLKIVYRNYMNETNEYYIFPLKIYFGSTQYHPQPQWLLLAEKYINTEPYPQLRTFAIKDIKKWK